jgi:three-Cys-motif partner protein
MLDLPSPEDDGFLIDDVGDWAAHKHHFLFRYLDAFTTAMRGKKWEGLHYVDLFAGPGVLRLKTSGRLEWGSPLIAAQIPAPRAFDGLHLCEVDSVKLEALKVRIARIDPPGQVQMILGDANERAHDVVAQLSDKVLTVAFLDPFGLHLHFKTLQLLAARRCDQIIFFPDFLDAVRNIDRYWEDPDSNLDRVLGSDANWRAVLQNVAHRRWAETLRDLYIAQIGTLGYRHFDQERISARGRRLYVLVFCSRHPVAARIWRGIARKKPGDQQTFDFSE